MLNTRGLELVTVSDKGHFTIMLVSVFSFTVLSQFFPFWVCLLLLAGWAFFMNRHLILHQRREQTRLFQEITKENVNSADETVQWLNHFLERFWKTFERELSAKILQALSPILVAYGVKLTHFTLGSQAPLLSHMKFIKLGTNENECVLDTFFRFPSYKSEIRAAIKIASGVTLPILVSDIAFAGECRLHLLFQSDMPYVKSIGISMPQHPEIDFCVAPLLPLDIMSIPALHSLVTDVIRQAMEPLIIHPNEFVVDLDGIVNATTSSTFKPSTTLLELCFGDWRDIPSEEIWVYCVVTINEERHQTDVKSSLDGPWHISYPFLFSSAKDTNIKIEIFEPHKLSAHILMYSKQINLETFMAGDKDVKVILPCNPGSIELVVKCQPVPWNKVAQELENDDLISLVENPLSGGRKLQAPQNEMRKRSSKIRTKRELAVKKLALSSGVIICTFHNGTHLAGTDDSPYVYVVLKLNQKRVVHLTKCQNRGMQNFNEGCEFLTKSIEDDSIKILVMATKSSPAATDEIVASMVLNLSEIITKNESGTYINSSPPFTYAFHGMARIRLSFEFCPLKFHSFADSSLTRSQTRESPLASKRTAALSAFQSFPSRTLISKNDDTKEVGHLLIWIHEAQNLISADSNGLSDPFVDVSLGRNRVKTGTKKRTLNPQWNEVLKFPLYTREFSGLSDVVLNVKDWDMVGNDDFLGSVSISPTKLLTWENDRLPPTSDPGDKHWFDLENIEHGKICISVNLVFFDGYVACRKCEKIDNVPCGCQGPRLSIG